MKKLFNHTKKSYDEWERYEENDWDVPENYEGEEAGEYTDSEEEYYAEDAETVYSDSEEAYYAEEAEGYYVDENGEYYAEDGYYAEEEYYEEGEYTEEGYYVDESGQYYAEEDYAEDEYYGEEAYYAEEEDEDYAEEKAVRGVLLGSSRVKPKQKQRKQGNVFSTIWQKFLEMAVMDRIITATGVTVLILALVTGTLYIGTRTGNQQVSALATVGSQLEGIELIGEKGLLAVADAEMARQAAAELVEEEGQKEYDEEEYSSAVTVKLNMTSVKKDLKIKFTNKDTGKLIANVPFSVAITDPDGKSETWSDDDMDGIIYKKNITPGTYKVLINELAGEKYDNYTIPSVSQNVEVKKDLSYEKIDVSDEVKTEDEIDVSKEDTKKNETEVESTLKDTVEWVESTAVAETYTEISKTTIQDPLTLITAKTNVSTTVASEGNDIAAAAIMHGTEGQGGGVSGGDVVVQPELNPAISPTAVRVAKGNPMAVQIYINNTIPNETYKCYDAVSENTNVATVTMSANGLLTITGVGGGTTNVTAWVDYATGTLTPKVVTVPVTVLDVALDKAETEGYVSIPFALQASIPHASAAGQVTVKSSNEAVATATVNGTTVNVNPVAEGETAITVVYTEGVQVTWATCNVTIKAHPQNNKTDKLKDNSGNQLFVLENEKYREAVYADYYTASKFFIKGEMKYTGWQTIGGKVYYFTKDGVKVTGEQVIQGAKYNFASDGSLITGSGVLGIDVSKWNGKIDWKAVKNSGISYVIIRCGYRGSSQGKLIEDPKFTTNIKGATEAGLKVGVYFFTQATDEIEAVEEASYVIDKIKNYRISYPVFLDVEPSGGRGDKIDKATRTAVCKAFCETIQRAGYTAGIYANKTWLNEKMDASQLSGYKIWLAQYAAAPTYTGRYDMWQYTSKGKVTGISGDVDLNLSYLGY